ncbi:MAG: flagellar basal body P-ring protein FlgI [Gammaproteobacteria bacterium]|nr:flagellar basal body P-ring protein FlgI [Gammaproteobacteria bacterium]
MRLIKYLFMGMCLLLTANDSFAARIKDITNIAGIRDNQLVGYGLVVGLNSSGDKVNQAPFTQQSFTNMLLQFGIRLPNNANLQLRNVAAVAISATLPPFVRLGQKIDITISSIGNASSLMGGTLLMAPLKGADGKVYAIAQGGVVVAGFGAQGSDGSKVTVNVPSSGSIPNGATVENTIEMPFVHDGKITFELSQPDFTTAEMIEQVINHEMGHKVAHTIDAGAVAVYVDDSETSTSYMGGPSYKGEGPEMETHTHSMGRFVSLISRIENLTLAPAHGRAKVIINARTGTIVAGEDVTIEPVAVTHGNLSVVVTERPFVSQPNAFSNGKTVKGKASDIAVNQAASRAFIFDPGPSLSELVEAINRVGAAPGDLSAILEAIKASGALHADLEII